MKITINTRVEENLIREKGYTIRIANPFILGCWKRRFPLLANVTQNIISNNIFNRDIKKIYDEDGDLKTYVFKSIGTTISSTRVMNGKGLLPLGYVSNIYNLQGEHIYGPSLLDLHSRPLTDAIRFVIIENVENQQILFDELRENQLGETVYEFDEHDRIKKIQYSDNTITEFDYQYEDIDSLDCEIFAFSGNKHKCGIYRMEIENYNNEDCIMSIKSTKQTISSTGISSDLSCTIDENGKYINPYISHNDTVVKVFRNDDLILVLPHKEFGFKYALKGLVKNNRVVNFDYHGSNYDVLYE